MLKKHETHKDMRLFLVLLLLVLPFTLLASDSIDLVVVSKSKKKLFLYSKGNLINQFNVVFGSNLVGHKVQEGDKRTPEGDYILDYKKSNSSFYKAIHISYPNENDIENAKKLGVNPGGLIMIHGQPNGFGWFSPILQLFNWTDGCIALSNKDMDIVWDLVKVGRPIKIKA
jgi:murein L,D-transpeptidase YafK